MNRDCRVASVASQVAAEALHFTVTVNSPDLEEGVEASLATQHITVVPLTGVRRDDTPTSGRARPIQFRVSRTEVRTLLVVKQLVPAGFPGLLAARGCHQEPVTGLLVDNAASSVELVFEIVAHHREGRHLPHAGLRSTRA